MLYRLTIRMIRLSGDRDGVTWISFKHPLHYSRLPWWAFLRTMLRLTCRK